MEAVQAPREKPLLIVAGAGTGKTRTLTSRVVSFIEEGVPPGEVCAITFTNKAAKEMEARIGNALGRSSGAGGRPFIGTFHSLGARILRKYAGALGRTPNFVIFDDHDSFALIKKILKDLDRRKESPALHRDKISEIKNGSAPPEKFPAAARDVFTRYENALRDSNAFDFDDLLQKAVLLFKKDPAALERYRRVFTHILIDEYQDLNDMQYEFIRLLASPSARGGQGASVSVVGDAEQTIYGWRGSNIEIFLRFPDEWPGSNMVTLTQNYRSTKNILGAASAVIAKNAYETKVKRATGLWTENPEGPPVTIVETVSEDAEAEWIAEKIMEGFRSGGAGDPLSTAILYRTNAQSRALEQALLLRRLPYRVFGGLKFYERREIKDVIAGLRYALNPADVVSRERLEKTFSKRVFRELDQALRGNGSLAPLALIGLFLKSSGYLEYIERSLTNPRERRENIEELIHFAGGYGDLPALLEEIALLQATDVLADKRTPNGKEISLMTIHLAKGLEFDRVFVAGCVEGLLPHARSIDTKEELQEERRLMYVAMTRARGELYLSFYGIPSRFLGEIPEEHAAFENFGGKASLDFNDEEYEERYISLD